VNPDGPLRQQILVMETERESLRAEADGWTTEDPWLVKPGPIGMSRSGLSVIPTYDCPLRALADGWVLLGPPVCETLEVEGRTHVSFTWYFGRLVDELTSIAASTARGSTR